MKVVFLGSTGLVGQALLVELDQHPLIKEINLISRKKSIIESNKINLAIYPELTAESLKSIRLKADVFICTIGTTIKKAKTKENFRRVDHDLAIAFAQMAKRSNASSFHIISSKGANSNSLFFYNKVKGDVENHLLDLKLPSVYIYRPSLLIGKREEERPAEKLGIFAYKNLTAFLSTAAQKNLGTHVHLLVRKMVNNITDFRPGDHVIESVDI